MVLKHGLKTVLMWPDMESLRLDKWLWAARFFKTRKLAADAIAGGKVHLNGQRCKPSKEIKPGAKLYINKPPYSWEITILDINGQRRPYSEAILLYQESTESLARREEQIALQKQQKMFMPYSAREKKPTKKERRQIHQFKHE